ncbi:hypothetical protein, partial [Vibrio parahaemolyticus]|uniref:hypothetical protein n=1 Tax=Vibrio parahaemolyticus TaxID=670 RepID=UPI001C603DE8
PSLVPGTSVTPIKRIAIRVSPSINPYNETELSVSIYKRFDKQVIEVSLHSTFKPLDKNTHLCI